MRKSSLGKTTFLSLLGISSATTSSWGEPFAVKPAAETSTDNLLPSASPSSTWGNAFVVDNSAVSTPVSSLPTSEAVAPSLVVDTASPVSFDTATADITVISGIQSAVPSRSAGLDPSASTQSVTGTRSVGSSTESATSASAPVEATGAAVPAMGFKKMGFVGAMAGAAGVMFV